MPQKGYNTIISIIVVVVVVIIIITFAPYEFGEIKGRQRKGRWQENTPRAGPGRKASLPRSDAEHPQCPWALPLLARPGPPACLPAQAAGSLRLLRPHQHPASLQNSSVSEKQAAVKGSWPDLLVVSAKCFNVQQAHL